MIFYKGKLLKRRMEKSMKSKVEVKIEVQGELCD